MNTYKHLGLWSLLFWKHRGCAKAYNAKRHIFWLIFFVLFFSCSVWAMKKPSFALKKEWERPLIALLDEAVRLQKAFYAQSDTELYLSSAKMVHQIKKLELSSEFLPHHQHFYIQNLLKNLLPPLESLVAFSFKGSGFCSHKQKADLFRQKSDQPFALPSKLKNSDCDRRGRESLKSISRALTYVAHVYGLNDYAVFFCPADRSVWMQKAKTHRYVSYSGASACTQIKQ